MADIPVPSKNELLPFNFNKGKIEINEKYVDTYRKDLIRAAKNSGYDNIDDYLFDSLTKMKNRQLNYREADPFDKGKWAKEDFEKLERLSDKFDLTPAETLAIIKHETGGTFNPATTNKQGATGLIQFTPTTAADYLLKEQRAAAISKAKTLEEINKAKIENPLYDELSDKEKEQAKIWAQNTISQLPVNRQLDLVDLYLTDRSKGARGLDKIYTTIFTGNPNTKSIPKDTLAYENNKALDKNRDGVITRDEWMKPVKEKVGTVNRDKEVLLTESSPSNKATIEEIKEIKDRASKILHLANPNISVKNIKEITKDMPLQIPNEGTPLQKEMEAERVTGFYSHPDNTSKLVPPSSFAIDPTQINRSSIPVIQAHEMGHAVGMQHTDDGGLMSSRRDISKIGNSYRDSMLSAIKSGGKVLDAEQQAMYDAFKQSIDDYTNQLYMPDFLKKGIGTVLKRFTPTVMPSEAHNFDVMQKAFDTNQAKGMPTGGKEFDDIWYKDLED